MFTIYLTRHAEKETVNPDPTDPPLSACGEQRAQHLATMLKAVELENVYSTPYLRTRNTALPTASAHGLAIEAYEPLNLDGFAGLLLEKKQNALVVGHSNTTAVLAGLLGDEPGEEFDESEYDRFYLVNLSSDDRQLTLLNQAFTCKP